MAQAGVDVYISLSVAHNLENENRPKFLDLKKVFWIKLADLLDIVPRYPHLAGVKLTTQDFVLPPWDYKKVVPIRERDGESSASTNDLQAHHSSLTNGDGSVVNGHK